MAAWIPVLPENIEILIVVMAIIYTSISIAAQRLLANTKRMRQIQAKVMVMQKEMGEMLKRNAPAEELAAKQKEFMPLIGEQMKNSMKPMMVILPLLLITYYLVIPNLPISSALLGGSKELFFILVFGIGMVAAIAILIYDRIMIKKETKILQEAADREKQLEGASAKGPQQNNQ
jgi:uncharacterized membrane protein (DUF106 family)